MLDHTTLILKKPSQDLINNLNYGELCNLSLNLKINDTVANFILKHPEVDSNTLFWLVRNSSIGESFYKEYVINHPAMEGWVLMALVNNPSISEKFHKQHTIKHSKVDNDILDRLYLNFPNTDWEKLCSLN